MSQSPRFNLRQVLASNAGAVYRIAVALCGEGGAAMKITRHVLYKSLYQSRTWKTPEDPARWFARFTILNTRGCKTANPSRDLLLKVALNEEIAGLIHALRHLPMQQREAFVLHHGQCMDLRQMATAMDCSATAASTHLTAATQTLRKLSPAGLGPLTLNFPRMLDQITAPPEQLQIQIAQSISKKRFRSFIRFGIAWPIILLGIAALGYAGYQFWKIILF